ncbi:hypothetical protein Bhyg_00278, partial [Pseudolycoriella hygida]
ILILCSTLNFTIIHGSYAEEKGLTCETQGVGDLLRTEFSHTCIPGSFFSFATANILSPGVYANTMLRLKINDHELFKESFPGGQCARNNKIDPKDPKLTFAFCNNIKLQTARVNAIATSAVAIAKAVLTGSDPWNDIIESWKYNKGAYHTIYEGRDGDSDFMFDLPISVLFKVIKDRDTMCVAAPTLVGWVPVGCKYVREPYPESIYGPFMGSSKAKESKNTPTDPMAIVDCGTSSSSCYQNAYENSKTAIVISSPLIECIKEMTARLLINKDVCKFDVNQVVDSSKRESSVLFQFQRNMHRTVTALLTIYVIFFGFKIILSSDIPPKNEIINFVLKMLFVTYFSVGINITPGSGSDYNRLDGMVQWAFPLLLGGIDTLGGWVMNASPSELCKFEPKDYGNKNLSYMPLWDALDCRVSHYLGLDILSTLLVENAYRNHSFEKFDFFSNMTLISLALSYPLLVISVGAFMVNATVMCMISIVILGVLAPLFVPMFLFEYTRGYFESWVKLLISFLLQPMVVVTFMIMMFSVYDFGFYGHCKYISKTIKNSIESGGDGKRDVKIFFVDNNWENYKKDESKDIDDAKSCKNSLGYMLNNPLATVFDFAKDNLNEMVKEKPGSGSTSSHLSKYQFLQGIIMGPGMFFVSPKLVFEKIKDIVLALITACFTLYLMYHLSAQLAEFAADMTEGVALSNVAIHPQAIYKAGMAAIGAAGKMGAADKAAGGAGAKDMMGGKGGESDGGGSDGLTEDSAATGGESAGDTVSTSGSAGSTGAVGGAIKSLGSSGASLPIRHITEATTGGVTEGGSSSAAGSSKESRANLETTSELVIPPTTKMVETDDTINKSSQAATNKQELGKTPNKVNPTLASPKEQKSNGLPSKTSREMEDHTIQPGEAGYMALMKVHKATYLTHKPSSNRPLRKLAYAEEFEGDAERRTAAYSNVREDSSTASTYKLPAEVEFPKRSNLKIAKKYNTSLRGGLSQEAIHKTNQKWIASLCGSRIPRNDARLFYLCLLNAMCKVSKVIQVFLQFCLIFFSAEVFAGYGDLCPLASFEVDDYLKQNTAYGHIMYSIDMTDTPGACEPTDPHDKQFKFCLKNKEGSSSECKVITLKEDDSKSLSELSTDNNPNLGGNSLLKDIILTIMLSYAYFKRATSISFSCNPKNDKVNLAALNPFSTFQESLKISIRAALILYVMFFAVNMILSKEYGNLDKIATFVMKLIVVAYFATGLGPAYFKGGKETTDNGMLQYGLPLLTELTPQFAQIVFNAGGSRGLCEFDAKKYKNGYSFYALWDAVDCRIAYYLGMGLIYNTEAILNGIPDNSVPPSEVKGTAIEKFKKPGNEAPDALSRVGALRFFTVLFGFLLSGNIIIVVSGIAFSVIFVSIVLCFLTHYLVCLITIYVMTYISPIFIPMALFTRTKAYFDAWLKICISCAIQPAVIAGFIALLLSMYDSAIYKNCEFMRHDYVSGNTQFSTFELRLPNSEPNDCKNSAGYKLLQYYSGTGWESHLLILFPIKSIAFDIFSLMVDLLYVLVFSIIFYHFSKSIRQFAAEITGGPIMDSVTASPTKIVDMVKQGIKFILDASGNSGGKMPAKNPAAKPRQGGAKGSGSGGEDKAEAGDK